MRLVLVSVLALAALAGCRGSTFEDPPFNPLRNMFNQPRYEPQSRSYWFEDERTMRTPVEGTVPREAVVEPTLGEGRTEDGGDYVDEIPVPIIRRMGGLTAMTKHGQERYGIYCTPCHDGTGGGQGMVIQAAGNPAFRPPSFHTEKVQTMTDGQLYATITHGVNNMPAYGPQIPVNDRWSIVAYVRALQLSMASKEAE